MERIAPFDVAAANGKWEVARHLPGSAGGADSRKDADGTSSAPGSQNSLSNTRQSLLSPAERVDAPDERPSSHIASIEGRPAHGADVNEPSPHQESPLGWASITGKLEVARVLINNGANVSSWDKYGGTPLHRDLGIMKSRGCCLTTALI
jgi:hypothetical protein